MRPEGRRSERFVRELDKTLMGRLAMRGWLLFAALLLGGLLGGAADGTTGAAMGVAIGLLGALLGMITGWHWRGENYERLERYAERGDFDR